MATFLFDEIIFGRVRIRRLVSSLGINLLAPEKEVCRLFKEIQPEAEMRYSYERDTAASGLQKAPLDAMKKIAGDIEEPGMKTLFSF